MTATGFFLVVLGCAVIWAFVSACIVLLGNVPTRQPPCGSRRWTRYSTGTEWAFRCNGRPYEIPDVEREPNRRWIQRVCPDCGVEVREWMEGDED